MGHKRAAIAAVGIWYDISVSRLAEVSSMLALTISTLLLQHLRPPVRIRHKVFRREKTQRGAEAGGNRPRSTH